MSTLRSQHADLTRELILQAVAALLQEESPGDVSMPAVARRAGVSLRTVYRYFAAREELLIAAADWINERMFGGVPLGDADPDRGPPPAQSEPGGGKRHERRSP